MDDDLSIIILVVLIAITLPIMAVASFIMVLGLRRRVQTLEQTVAMLRAGVRPLAAPASVGETERNAADMSAEPPTVAVPDQTPASEEIADAGKINSQPEVVPTPPDPVAAETPSPQPTATLPRPPRTLEETLGARWAVWIGGLALLLGGVFLVRYSIEAGLIGPGLRVVCGLLFSFALLAVGEVLRRRQGVPETDNQRAAYIPGIVTAAGTAALFATIYAAYALYGFIGPAAAFILLGLIGIGTMVLAALHGPALAALGLVAAYATPLLVSSKDPQPWPLAIYLLVVTAAAFCLARLRLWRWLAVTATALALVWGIVLVGILEGPSIGAPAAYVAILVALVLGLLVVDAHRGRDGFARFDLLATAASAGVAALALLLAMGDRFGPVSLGIALAIAAALLAAGLAFEEVSLDAGVAALLAAGLAFFWPVAEQAATEPVRVIVDRLVLPPTLPDAVQFYAGVMALCAAALFLGTGRRLFRREAATPAVVALATAGVAGPLVLLALAYVRLTGFGISYVFGILSLAAAAILAVSTDRLLRRSETAAAVHAAGSVAALALALSMSFGGSVLTLAFSLAALGTAWVSTQRPVPALRYGAAALAVLVLLRTNGAWTVIGEAATTFPSWTEIIERFALPAIAIGLAGLILRRRTADTPAAILDGAGLVLGTAAAALALRLWVVGPEGALNEGIGLAEAGLYATLAAALAIATARSAPMTNSIVYRIAAPLFGFGTILVAWLGPLLAANPYLVDDQIEGGPVLNTLLTAYAVPVLAVLALRFIWQRLDFDKVPSLKISAKPLDHGLGVTALILAFTYVTFETRRLAHGPDMSFSDMSTGESYAYSAVWLIFGVALLAGGLALASKGARLASAVIILITVAKVFLIDMSDLEGIWRALSFIGLGVVLIGIGLVYQRFVFGSRGATRSGDLPTSPQEG